MPPKECCQKNIAGEGHWIGCDAPDADDLCPGKGWYHLECLGMSKQEMEKIEKYYCNVCSIRLNLRTTYNILGERNSNTDTTMDGINDDLDKSSIISEASSASYYGENNTDIEHEPKKIHQHEIDYNPEGPSQMLFLVEWEGYPNKEDFTWQTEDSLSKCFELVHKYRRENKLAPTKLKPIGGCSSTRDFNMDNWVTLDRLLQTANQYLSHQKYSSDLIIRAFHSLNFVKPRRDSITFLLNDCHYYCILTLTDSNVSFISDGANSVMDEATLLELKRITKMDLKPIPTDKKMRIDHCAAGAILSAMEYSRSYKIKDFAFSKLSFPESYFERLTKTLYQEKSHATEGRKDIKLVSRFQTCERCGVFKTSKGRGALLSHQRQKCPGKNL